MKRVAAGDADKAEANSTERAMTGDSFHHIFGASGAETAGGGQHGGDAAFIETEKGDGQPLHFRKSLSTSASRLGKGAVCAERRGFNTMSQPGFNCSLRSLIASLIRLLMRLRITALPSARGVVKPKRDSKVCGEAGAWETSSSGPARSRLRQKAAKNGQVSRTPVSYTLRYSAFFRIRADLGRLVGSADSSFVAHGELPAAPGAAAREYGAAIRSLHTGAETVHFGATAIIGLKRSLWHYIPSDSVRASQGASGGNGIPWRETDYA